MLLDIQTDLRTLCAPGDRQQAVERLLNENGVPAQKIEYADGAINYVINFGSMWTWKKVFAAHYDRVPEAPGANDNGASVVCLIKLAAQLIQEDYKGPLAIVLFDKEEPCNRGRLGSGSRRFGKTLAERDLQPELFVILDVIGFGDVLFHDPYGDPDMVEMLEAVSPNLRSKHTPGSDDVLLSQEGIESVLLCAIPRHEFVTPYPMTWNLLHTRADDVDTVEPDTVAWVGRVLYQLSRDEPQVVEDIPLYEEKRLIDIPPLWDEDFPGDGIEDQEDWLDWDDEDLVDVDLSFPESETY